MTSPLTPPNHHLMPNHPLSFSGNALSFDSPIGTTNVGFNWTSSPRPQPLFIAFAAHSSGGGDIQAGGGGDIGLWISDWIDGKAKKQEKFDKLVAKIQPLIDRSNASQKSLLEIKALLDAAQTEICNDHSLEELHLLAKKVLENCCRFESIGTELNGILTSLKDNTTHKKRKEIRTDQKESVAKFHDEQTALKVHLSRHLANVAHLKGESQAIIQFVEKRTLADSTSQAMGNESEIIFTKGATDQEKQAALIRWEALYRDQQARFASFQQTSSGVEDHIDWSYQQSILDIDSDTLHFYVRSAHENLSELHDLERQQQFAHYLRKSHYYSHKLFEQGNFKELIQFAKEWLNSIPQDTPWEHLQGMGQLAFQAACKEGISEADFGKALAAWVKKRPDLQWNAPHVQQTEALREGAASMELLLGHLHIAEHLTTLETINLYRNCSLLDPYNPKWNRKLASCYISVLQWSKAKETLIGLDPESAQIIQLELATSQYEIGHLVVDVAKCTFSLVARRLPRNWQESPLLRISHSIVHISLDQNLRSYWLPKLCTEYHQQLQTGFSAKPSVYKLKNTTVTLTPKHKFAASLALSLANYAAVPLLDAYFPDRPSQAFLTRYVRTPLSMLQSVALGTNSALTLWAPKSTLEVPITVVSLACTVVCLSGDVSSYSHKKFSPAVRAIGTAARNAIVPLSAIQMAYQHGTVLKSLFNTALIRYCPTKVMPYATACVTACAGLSQLAVGVASAAIPVFNGFYTFRIARAIYIVEDAELRREQGEFEEVRDHLIDAAKGWRLVRGDLIQTYLNCVDELVKIPTLLPDHAVGFDDESIPKIDAAIKAFKKAGVHTRMPFILLCAKLEGYFLTEQYDQVNFLLSEKNIDRAVLINFVTILLGKIQKHSDDHPTEKEAVVVYIDKILRNLFLHLGKYKSLFLRYGELVVCRRERALDNKEETFRNLLNIATNKLIINSINELLKHVPKLDFPDFCYELLSEKIRIHIQEGTKNYAEIDRILHHEGSSSGLHLMLAGLLINSAETGAELGAEFENISMGVTLKEAGTELIQFQFRSLISSYETYFTGRMKKSPDKDRIKTIDHVLLFTKKRAEFSKLHSKLLAEKLQLLINLNEFDNANEALELEGPESDVPSLLANSLMEAGSSDSLKEASKHLPNQSALLSSYANYLACSGNKSSSVDENIEKINAVLEQLRPKNLFMTLYIKLQLEKLRFLIGKEDFIGADNVLQREGSSSEIHHQLLFLTSDRSIKSLSSIIPLFSEGFF